MCVPKAYFVAFRLSSSADETRTNRESTAGGANENERFFRSIPPSGCHLLMMRHSSELSWPRRQGRGRGGGEGGKKVINPGLVLSATLSLSPRTVHRRCSPRPYSPSHAEEEEEEIKVGGVAAVAASRRRRIEDEEEASNYGQDIRQLMAP